MPKQPRKPAAKRKTVKAVPTKEPKAVVKKQTAGRKKPIEVVEEKSKFVVLFERYKRPALFAATLLLTVFLTTLIYTKATDTSLQELFRHSGQEEQEGGPKEDLYPLTVEYMRQQEYPGSTITIEQTLPAGSNYDRYIASYKSDGLKIYALLTIPQGEKPKGGWPVIIFNHGYIPPAEYRTNERYIEYTDAFSRNGYIVFRSDYRGHGNSEGNPEGGYYSPAYSIDVLNAVSSIKKLTNPLQTDNKEVISNPQKIGMWGHSMGGALTLRTMVTTKDVKAGVIWAGVVADYNDLHKNWTRSYPFVPSEKELAFRRLTRERLEEKFGTVDKNPAFWQSIAPISFVNDISGPVQIHHGTNDGEVPVLFSERLDQAMKKANKGTELYVYEGDDHNIAFNLYTALDRSLQFFDKNLK